MVISVFLSVCVCVDAKKVYQKYTVFTTVYWKRGGSSAYIQRQQRERHSLQSSACNASSVRPTNSEVRETEAGCARLLPSF